jgi:hypothetical protein
MPTDLRRRLKGCLYQLRQPQLPRAREAIGYRGEVEAEGFDLLDKSRKGAFHCESTSEPLRMTNTVLGR